jgi:hypothetical protein
MDVAPTTPVAAGDPPQAGEPTGLVPGGAGGLGGMSIAKPTDGFPYSVGGWTKKKGEGSDYSLPSPVCSRSESKVHGSQSRALSRPFRSSSP